MRPYSHFVLLFFPVILFSQTRTRLIESAPFLSKISSLQDEIAALSNLPLRKPVRIDSLPDILKIYGRIKFVTSFADYKVKIVTSFADLHVKVVTSFPDKPGRWKIVDSFPDFTVQIVDSFADFTIKYVDSFPGPQH